MLIEEKKAAVKNLVRTTSQALIDEDNMYVCLKPVDKRSSQGVVKTPHGYVFVIDYFVISYNEVASRPESTLALAFIYKGTSYLSQEYFDIPLKLSDIGDIVRLWVEEIVGAVDGKVE